MLPKKLVCCKQSRSEEALELARQALCKEVDLVEMVRSQRILHAALSILLKDTILDELKEKNKFKVISLDQRVEQHRQAVDSTR